MKNEKNKKKITVALLSVLIFSSLALAVYIQKSSWGLDLLFKSRELASAEEKIQYVYRVSVDDIPGTGVSGISLQDKTKVSDTYTAKTCRLKPLTAKK